MRGRFPQETLVPAMTRYSRSVMPGRPAEPQDVALDRMMFGRQRGAAANDADEPDFLPPMQDDEADLLVGRASQDRRGNPDRRAPMGDRRKSPAGRRANEYVPLRDGASVRSEDGRRGPLLLAGALLIVLVFAVVVWNAYSDGVQSDTAELAPELSTSGGFKTPPRDVIAAPVVTEATSVDVAIEDELAGAPTGAAGEERPTPPPPAQASPPPSKFTAPPPAPLKDPVRPAAQPAPAASVPATPAPSPATPVQTAAVPKPPAPAAATPAPASAAPTGDAYRPVFQASGDHVVQIAATSTESSAVTEWAKLQKAHPDLLSSAERFIQQADVNGRTVYRLRVGSFASKADANAFCAAFKAKGGNCYPAVK